MGNVSRWSDSDGARADDLQTENQFPQQAEFFHQLQQHDSECWDVLLSIYAPRLRQDITRSLLKRDLTVEWVGDIEQETWLTAVRQIENFVWEDESRLYHWFRSIATFHVRNLERKVKNRYVSLEEIDDEVDESGLSLDFFLYVHGLIEDSPEVRVSLRESMRVLDQAMQMLKPREQEIVLRRLLYNESIQTLAGEYAVKPETISVILVRAKKSILAYVRLLNQQ